MMTYLAKHATDNVWVRPKQDRQYILKPERLTDPYGAWNYFRIVRVNYPLPKSNKRYHVYHYGKLEPSFYGMFDTDDEWVKASDAMVKESMIFDVYTGKGIMIPRHQVYVRWTADSNFIIAVEENKNINWNHIQEDIYIRMYSGTYFNVTKQDEEKELILYQGRTIVKEDEKGPLYDWYLKHRDKNGHVFVYVNGYYREIYDNTLVKVGDTVELVYDSTIYKKVTYNINNLQTFHSTKDKKRKYLLAYDSQFTEDIDYLDDIDIYVVRKSNQYISKNKGVYYYRNQEDAVRQLTHRDLSIVPAYVEYLITSSEIGTDSDHIQIVQLIRKSGLKRPLLMNKHRIHELYKLPYHHRVNAMVGINSAVEVWQAANLETSKYVELMELDSIPNDEQLIVEAYGYNTLAKVIGDTPTTKFTRYDDKPAAYLPYIYRRYASGYEYDQDGYLIDVNSHLYGCYFPLRNKNTKLLEMMSSYARDSIDDVFNPSDTFKFLADREYRVYMCDKGDESIPSAWKDITNLSYYRVREDKSLEWVIDRSDKTILIRSDIQHLYYSLKVTPAQGFLQAVLSQRLIEGTHVKNIRMLVPLGVLDLWLNGKALVEGIDYIFEFPFIAIVNKEYYRDDLPYQILTVRYSEFCDRDLNRYPDKKVGYVKHGTLSRNKRFDVRDDKVQRISIGGRVVDPKILKYEEDHKQITLPDNIKEGSPYEIRDILVTTREIYGDSYDEKKKSEEIDTAVENYMTQYFPDKVYPREHEIEDRHHLYSPFIGYLIQGLVDGTIVFDRLTAAYSDNDVIEFLKPHEWLLKFDPLLSELSGYDEMYVAVHPHIYSRVVKLDLFQYRFLRNVVRIYYKSKLDLSKSIEIKEMNNG